MFAVTEMTPFPPGEDRLHRDRILAAHDLEPVGRAVEDLPDPREVPGRFLDGDDVGEPGEPGDGVRLHVAGGPPGHVVEDLRDVDGLRDELEVPVQALLGGLVVVGRHQQAAVGPEGRGVAGQVQRLGGRVRPGPGDHRHPARHRLDDLADHLAVLVVVEGGRLAGGPDRDDGVGAGVDVELDQPGEGIVVHRAVFAHRGDHGHHASPKHRNLLRALAPEFPSPGDISASVPRERAAPEPLERPRRLLAGWKPELPGGGFPRDRAGEGTTWERTRMHTVPGKTRGNAPPGSAGFQPAEGEDGSSPAPGSGSPVRGRAPAPTPPRS